MKTPRDKYYNDPNFKSLVDMMCAYICNCDFTPSEMRQAAVLASIKYEETNIDRVYIVDRKLEEALSVLSEFSTKEGK